MGLRAPSLVELIALVTVPVRAVEHVVGNRAVADVLELLAVPLGLPIREPVQANDLVIAILEPGLHRGVHDLREVVAQQEDRVGHYAAVLTGIAQEVSDLVPQVTVVKVLVKARDLEVRTETAVAGRDVGHCEDRDHVCDGGTVPNDVPVEELDLHARLEAVPSVGVVHKRGEAVPAGEERDPELAGRVAGRVERVRGYRVSVVELVRGSDDHVPEEAALKVHVLDVEDRAVAVIEPVVVIPVEAVGAVAEIEADHLVPWGAHLDLVSLREVDVLRCVACLVLRVVLPPRRLASQLLVVGPLVVFAVATKLPALVVLRIPKPVPPNPLVEGTGTDPWITEWHEWSAFGTLAVGEFDLVV
mmetsp:Transcript_39109/g.92647  ORF Transcript_39109/g.92647 Transcript_39109/m.92647 type:complete len:359 (+) Transcript_39109:3150-4226(+)